MAIIKKFILRLIPSPRNGDCKDCRNVIRNTLHPKSNDNIFIDEGASMKKAILFDWNGVLVRELITDNHDRNELYNKVLNNTATQDQVKLLVQSFEKFEPLWDMLPKLTKHFKLCVVNNGPKATLDYWDEYYEYSRFMKFVNSEEVGIAKPNPEIYRIACELIGVNTDEVIYMDDSCGFPTETEALNMKFIHWDTFEVGFEKFKHYLREVLELDI